MPISFHQDVGRIFAYHCNGCHGEAGGLNLRSYEAAIAGGNKGKVIIAGDAENSLLIHFIEGRRGDAHRMPAGGEALAAEQIEIIRQWINEGARRDAKPAPILRELKNVKLEPNKVLRITCRVPARAYITVSAVDPTTNETLWSEVASIKSPKEQNDAASPGDQVHWDVRPAYGWPVGVTLRLSAEYTERAGEEIEFSAELD